ncbi:MAG: hypothetical protein QOI81_1846 [Actinomycetota bacterium]|jgi:hypothetical protein|nr:hypothetical protein [Actinomycetota bacterium]
MSFSVEGDYFETCNCTVSCPCIWLRPADNENCDVMLAWHVKNGNKDGVDLAGMSSVMVVHSPKQMTDGNWKVALYTDDRATPEQSEALGAVFSGAAGGHLAGLAPLIGEVAGVAPAAISFDRSGGSLRAEIPGTLSMSSEEQKGMDGATAPVISNPMLGALAQPVSQAKAGDVSYHGHWDIEYSGTNSFVSDFKYEG